MFVVSMIAVLVIIGSSAGLLEILIWLAATIIGLIMIVVRQQARE